MINATECYLLLLTGSTNNDDRGGLGKLFEELGLDIPVYKPGSDDAAIGEFKNFTHSGGKVKVYVAKPQNVAPMLEGGPIMIKEGAQVGALLIGQDLMHNLELFLKYNPKAAENVLEYKEKMTIGNGHVNIVCAIPKNEYKRVTTIDGFLRSFFEKENVLKCYIPKEYRWIVEDYFRQNRTFLKICAREEKIELKELLSNKESLDKLLENRIDVVELGSNGTSDYYDKRIRIVLTDGQTESFAVRDEKNGIKGPADMIIDNTQTGRSLKKANLRVIDNIRESVMSLFLISGLSDEMERIYTTLAEQLKNALNSDKRCLVCFNTPKTDVDKTYSILNNKKGDNGEKWFKKGPSVSMVLSTSDVDKTNEQSVQYVAMQVLIPKSDYMNLVSTLVEHTGAEDFVKIDASVIA